MRKKKKLWFFWIQSFYCRKCRSNHEYCLGVLDYDNQFYCEKCRSTLSLNDLDTPRECIFPFSLFLFPFFAFFEFNIDIKKGSCTRCHKLYCPKCQCFHDNFFSNPITTRLCKSCYLLESVVAEDNGKEWNRDNVMKTVISVFPFYLYIYLALIGIQEILWIQENL